MEKMSDLVLEFRGDALNENRMDQLVPADFFARIRQGKYCRKLYPAFAERGCWQELLKSPQTEELCKNIIADAEKFRLVPPVFITYSEFCRFGRDGNRNEFEKKYFERRDNLGSIALALCLTGDKEKYMGSLLDYLEAILSEARWVLPAHCLWEGDVLQEHCQTDLFASETAAMSGLLVQILGPDLEQAAPGILQRIRSKVKAETLDRLYSPASRQFNRWYFAMKNNWAAWVSENLLLSGICFEDDPVKMAELLQLLFRPVSRFVQNYGEDGYCTEGTSYFYEAGGRLFRFALLLDRMIPGSMERFWAEPKHRAIFCYLAQMSIGDHFASYGDCGSQIISPYLCGAIGAKCHSVEMAQLSRRGDRSSSRGDCGSTLQKELSLLFDFPSQLPEGGSWMQPLSWFKNRIAIGRTKGFTVSLKAGTNGEFHNHNDLGMFTLDDGKTPVILDPGSAMAYSRDTFSAKRYTLWHIRASGHNAPLINGIEQQHGEEYSAKLPHPEKLPDGKFRMVCDLSHAYPAEAQVREFTRTLTAGSDTLVVEDKINAGNFQDVEINLIAMGEPERQGNMLRIGSVTMSLENLAIASIQPANTKSRIYSGPQYRIVLKGTNPAYRITFRK